MSLTMFDVGNSTPCNCGPSCTGTNSVSCITCFADICDELHITDANGTYTATWQTSLSLWVTTQLCAASNSPCAACVSGVSSCTGAGGACQPLYIYGIGCTSAGHMTFNRYWYEANCGGTYNYCPCGCGVLVGAQAYSSSGSVAVTCGSIAWSGTLTKVVGSLADPVGGTTSFHQ